MANEAVGGRAVRICRRAMVRKEGGNWKSSRVHTHGHFRRSRARPCAPSRHRQSQAQRKHNEQTCGAEPFAHNTMQVTDFHCALAHDPSGNGVVCGELPSVLAITARPGPLQGEGLAAEMVNSKTRPALVLDLAGASGVAAAAVESREGM